RLPGASGRTCRIRAPQTSAKPRRGATNATGTAVAKIASTARERRRARRRVRSERLYATSTHTNSPAYAATGDDASRVRATQWVAKGRSDTPKRWPKLIQINPGVGGPRNRNR